LERFAIDRVPWTPFDVDCPFKEHRFAVLFAPRGMRLNQRAGAGS
jgi:hypothetical protein